MRLALIGWAADSGVGRELCDAAIHLPVVGAFVLTHASKRNRFDLVPEPIRTVSHGRDPAGEMAAFLDHTRADVVLTWEGPARWEFVDVWRAKGVRWTLRVNWDWFPAECIHAVSQADLIAPNEMCRSGLKAKYRLESTLLPVPVDLGRFPFVRRDRARRFGMAYGAGGPHDRRCLRETLAAWRLLPAPPPLLVRAQARPPEFEETLGVELRIENLYDPADLYSGFDVAVQPSRFEGAGFVLLEAQACGAPVVTVDAEPMRTAAPDLLVPAARSTVSNMKGHEIDAWTPAPEAIAAMVARLDGQPVGELSERARRRVEREYSWATLRERWIRFLSGRGGSAESA